MSPPVILAIVVALAAVMSLIGRYCTLPYLARYLRLKLRGDRLLRVPAPPAHAGPAVVVTLTSIPSRLGGILPTINSLLLQSRPPDRIELNLPREAARERLPYVLPPGLETDPRIRVHWIPEDRGPILKILPTLERESDPETILITVDDDTIYPYRLIETLIENHQMLKDAALGFRGWKIPPSGRFVDADIVHANQVDRPLPVDVLTGISGVLYLRRHFAADFFERDHLPPEGFFEDDLCLSGYLEQAGVERYVLPFPMREPFSRYVVTSRSNPLWKINRCGGNGQVMLDFYWKAAAGRGA